MKQVIDPKVRTRRLLVRAALIVVFAGLVVLMFNLGKLHTFILDNKNLADGSLTAARGGNLVSIDGREASEIYPGERSMEKVKGQRHTITVTSLSGTDKVVRRISLDLDSEMMLVSLPRLIAGKEPYMEVFVPLNVVTTAEERAGTDNSFTSPEAGGTDPVVIPTP